MEAEDGSFALPWYSASAKLLTLEQGLCPTCSTDYNTK